eukprot:TRINITY_DN2496_c0_g1_i1.p1 TRINITY_DN2496_c0_g1~~TRINITY_DN2496_c0_g1_i1.p1  ORF type:complete len:121 (-),score=17.25 TRINITY_DN2496_c0_g1_i1:245-607(-)
MVILLGIAGAALMPWFQYILIWSYVKVGCTWLKYMPQAYYNYQRRSTLGWSIGNVLLDLTGGLLSFAQQFVDATISDSWTTFTGDPAKVALSAISVCFDVLFIIQHYCLYGEQPRYKELQ